MADQTSSIFSGIPPIDQVGEHVVHHVLNSTEWSPLPGVHLHIPQFLTLTTRDLNMNVSVHVLMLLIALTVISVSFLLLGRRSSRVAPKGIANLLELMVVFVRDQICVQNFGESLGRKFTPYFLTLFFLILTLNFMSLVPGIPAATANINMTFALAIMTFFIMVVGGLWVNGPIKFWKAFLPSGVPWWMMPAMFVIELASMFIRVFALMLRLFANMVGGHILIGVLVGMILAFAPWKGYFVIPMALFIYALEILVAFLQAYIFCLLSAIFISGMLHPEH